MSLLDDVLKDLERQWRQEEGVPERGDRPVDAPQGYERSASPERSGSPMEGRADTHSGPMEAPPPPRRAPVPPAQPRMEPRHPPMEEPVRRLVPAPPRPSPVAGPEDVPQRTVIDSLPAPRPVSQAGRLGPVLASRLRHPRALRDAMVLREILDRPVALRPGRR